MPNSILIPVEDTPLLQNPYKKVLDTLSGVRKQLSASDRSPQKKSDYILPVLALAFRGGSCTFRGTTISDFGSNVLRLPFVNAIHSSDAVHYGIILPTVLFASADMIMTLISSKKGVFQLLLHPNYRQGIKNQYVLFKSGEYPKLLLLLAPFGMTASGLKGYAGMMWLFGLMDSNPSLGLSILFNILAVTTGAFSAFCFLAFQINQQAFLNLQTKKTFKLDENKEAIKQVRKKHWCSLMRIKIESNLLTIASSLINGIAVFYSKGSFESNWILDVLAVALVISNAALNIFYVTNETYENWYIKRLCENQLKIREKRNVADAPEVSINTDTLPEETVNEKMCSVNSENALKILLKVIGGVSAVGTGLALGPGVIHLLLRLSGAKEIQNEKLSICVTGLALTFVLAILAASRDFVVWTLSSLPNLFTENKSKLPQTEPPVRSENSSSVECSA